jgi:class 3 adenylate cyclase/tetratricopeptide (TPR) repeat protein
MPACSTCGFESDRAFRFCPECGAQQAAAAPSHEQRKTVTVLFCDLSGSTALGESIDPERLRVLLANYFERMKAIVERHGGTVEKFIGDAVMAIFGVPVLHEDDALRAVRSAAEMRDALSDLGLQGRIGVTTGEVVTGTEERLATGDAVNVAARLEQAAQPGEVLIGHPTLVLVGETAEVEEVEPLALKGKAEPVTAYRLIGVGDAPERPYRARFVGREREFAIVREAWERVAGQRRCELVTVIGDAGVGKSRLAAELLASIDATTVRGRCPPYGEGITYWPVVEVLKQLDVSPPNDAAAVAIRSVLGEDDGGTSAEEIAWAFRKTLEHVAADQPLVIVFDDIQWGEQTFLDLIEHVALLSSDASMLLLCTARPELTGRRPTWPVTLRLEPLHDDAVHELISERVAGELRTKIARAAGGNPLFIEEMLAIADEAGGEVIVPPTLHALLAARLDQLQPAERSVLELGSIEGEIFHRGAVQALAPEGTTVTPHLAALVRKEMIRPDRPQLAAEDGFRFRHILIRDAAYEALPKARRADLHERLAPWLERHGTDLVEPDEIVGYHLERACRYREELGLPAEEELTSEARLRLRNAAHRAGLRQDYAAVVSLLERAVSLAPDAESDLALETEIGDALIWIGRGHDALRRAEALTELASASGDRVGELCGMIQAGIVGLYRGAERAAEELTELVEQALPLFEAAGDDMALYLAHAAFSEAAEIRGRWDAGMVSFERALAHARRAGYLPPSTVGRGASSRFFGTTHVAELLAWLDANELNAGQDQFLLAYRAGALAMLGDFAEARGILGRMRTELTERGGGLLLANINAFESVDVELLAGAPAAAAEFAEEGFRQHEELGELTFLSAAAGNVAKAMYALDRFDDAAAWADRAAELGAPETVTEMIWRQVKAKVLARRGEHADAARLAREAVALGEGTESPDVQGCAHEDLAQVLLLGGEREESIAAFERAAECYERKGNLVSTERVRGRLSEILGSVAK